MCGVAGIVGVAGADDEGARPLADRVASMTAAQGHRGPDADGLRDAGFAVIGQNRLSIIDLVTGDQPMPNEDGSLWVVFNGEIYNYKQLRQELQAAGHRFRSASDTEVLVHGYEEWGEALFDRLDGVYGFALCDERRRRVLLVRDPFGVKPLHYHTLDEGLVFASEVKGLFASGLVPREADPQSLHLFMNLRYVPGDGTLFRHVRRLPPGHVLTWEDGRVLMRRYFRLEYAPDHGKDATHFAAGVRERLRDAVRRQMVADVDVGVYLSGGLDSSAITAFMSEAMRETGGGAPPTFCLGFDEPTDELADARVVAEHFATEHHETVLDLDPLRNYPSVIWHVEEPKENILQGYLLAKFARDRVKVCHGGLGGDELFAGYTVHRLVEPFQRLHALIPTGLTRGLLAQASRLAFMAEDAAGRLAWDERRRAVQLLFSLGDPRRFYAILRNVWDFDPGQHRNVYGSWMLDQSRDPVERSLAPYFEGRGALEDVLWAEFHTKMVDDFLLNEDRTSMAHGLEVRVPFLDKELVRFAWTIPASMKLRRGETKHVFKQAMTGLLPPHTLAKKKWGFTVDPVHQYRKDLKEVAQRVLTRERVEARGWFNHAYLQRILDHPPHPRLRWHYFFLWLAMGLEMWGRMYLDGEAAASAPRLEEHFAD